MPPNERIYLSVPHMSGREQNYIHQAFETNWITSLGANVDEFEKQISEYLAIPHIVALSSGTAALHLALKVIGTKPGDVIFCSSFTFAASANPIIYENAEPVFIDSNFETWNLCPKALRLAFEKHKKIGRLPKALIAVGLYGQSADIDPILEMCREYNCILVEDAAEVLGATYKGKKAGSLGDISILSFNGNKIITTSGGGALVSKNQDWIARARHLSTQARQPVIHYEHTEVGYNYRMSNILAGIGRAQMEVLDERVKQRRDVFGRYFESLKDIPGINFMPEASFGKGTRWLTALTLNSGLAKKSVSQLIQQLANENIETRPTWKPMNLQPIYSRYPFFSVQPERPVCNQIFENGLCLPSSSSLSPNQQEEVIKKIRFYLQAE